MTTTFQPTSTFGGYCLRQIFEGLNAHFVAQLLNVPVDAAGDRTTWTWEDNWKNYAIASAFTSTAGALNLRSTGSTPPSSIATLTEATSPFIGAYYSGDFTEDNRYAYIYNNSAAVITYTHVAFFVKQPAVASSSALLNLSTSNFAVFAANSDQSAATLNAFSYLFLPFAAGIGSGAAIVCATSFDDFVATDEAWVNDYTSPSPTYTAPYPINAGYATSQLISANRSTHPFFSQAFKDLLGVTAADSVTSFFGELLNVTGVEPSSDQSWSSWEAYRTNRYSVASVNPAYSYTTKSGSYNINIGGTDFNAEWTGQQVNHETPLEFMVTPPASGFYTFTHIAVFVNEADSPPQPGTTYVYADPTKFAGVIRLSSATTMTASSAARAYPFNFAFMFNPALNVQEI